MVIGRRWNVRWQRSSHLYRPEAVSEAARTNGHLHVACAVDYFLIAGNRFPWRDMRDAVIARRGYDNFLVTFAAGYDNFLVTFAAGYDNFLVTFAATTTSW